MTSLFALVLSLTTFFVQQSPPPAPGPVASPSEGILRPAAGVTAPRLIRETKPTYTGAAVRARIQGVVRLQCVVEIDGTVGDVSVTRSLDAEFGLDEEAEKVARK